MIGLAFHMEDAHVSAHSGDVGAMVETYKDLAAFTGADTLIMLDATKYKVGQYAQPNSADVEFIYYGSLDEMERCLPEVPRIYVETPNTVEGMLSLDGFPHPKEAIYIFGRDNGGIPRCAERKGMFLTVPMEPGMPGHQIHVASIVMYDRWRQWQSQ